MLKQVTRAKVHRCVLVGEQRPLIQCMWSLAFTGNFRQNVHKYFVIGRSNNMHARVCFVYNVHVGIMLGY